MGHAWFRQIRLLACALAMLISSTYSGPSDSVLSE